MLSLKDISSNTPTLINIYPNPTTGIFSIELSDNQSGIVKIQIVNIMGKTVFEQENFKGREISLSNTPAGIYFVRVTLQNQVLTQKIIIK